MARPRGTARSRRHVPPLDKPSRSGLLALRRFHDGLQTPALVRLLVRTEKEEIMPRPHPHDIPKRNRIWKPEISKCDFFLARHGGKRAASAFPTKDTRHRPPKRNSFNSLLRRPRPTSNRGAAPQPPCSNSLNSSAASSPPSYISIFLPLLFPSSSKKTKSEPFPPRFFFSLYTSCIVIHFILSLKTR